MSIPRYVCSSTLTRQHSFNDRPEPHLWEMKTTGRWPMPAAVRRSVSCSTVPHSGSDSPCGGPARQHAQHRVGAHTSSIPTVLQRLLSRLHSGHRISRIEPPSQMQAPHTPWKAAAPSAGPQPASWMASSAHAPAWAPVACRHWRRVWHLQQQYRRGGSRSARRRKVLL